MTPARLTELTCPGCWEVTWVIDSDHLGMGGSAIPYPDRRYACSKCRHDGSGWTLGRQSPPEFLMQPHFGYPMTRADFDRWVGVLRTHFPDHPAVARIATTFVPCLPEEAAARRSDFEQLHPVGEMKDQDGARRANPEWRHVDEWVELMTPGDTLTLSRRDGGSLVLTADSGSHAARCLDHSGSVLAEATGLNERAVRGLWERYLRGEEKGDARRHGVLR